MTTYFPFTPSNSVAPSFQPTLDSNVYTVVLTWNLFGQRYYVNCYDQNNTLVFSVALIETGPALTIETLIWDGASLSIELTTTSPHGFGLGMTLNLTIAEASPDAYNGTYSMLVDSPTTLNFAMTNDPGTLVTSGTLSYLISLCAGYFTSTMVYRNTQFEVSP